MVKYITYKTIKKIELVSLYEIENYPKLWEHLDLSDNEYFEDGPLSFFEGDPDMIKYEDYIKYFMFIELDNVLYVISNTDESEVWDILERFARPDFKENFSCPKPNDWNSFYNVDNAIAFRNGKGYVYTIWHY